MHAWKRRETREESSAFLVVARRGFEPLIPWLRTMYPRPLDERASLVMVEQRWYYISRPATCQHLDAGFSTGQHV